LLNQSSISTAFFDVCVSAAMKISLILETSLARSGPGLPLITPAVQMAACVLAIALFGGAKAGLVVDEHALEEGLKRCLAVAKASQELWVTARMRM
jgi:hypothetical protein